MRPRIARIETLRGVAIALLVWFHVVGADRSLGIHTPDDSWWRHGCASFSYLRMPLFTAISGWLYAARPVFPGHAATFLRAKARRLLLPLVTVGSLHWLIHPFYPLDGHPEPLSQIWRVLFFQYIHLWYLQALALVFVLVVALERAGALRQVGRFWVTLLAAFAFSYWAPTDVTLLSFKGFGYLLPYFLLGLGLGRFEHRVRASFLVGLCLVTAIVLQLRFELGYFMPLPPLEIGRRTPFGFMLSSSWVVLALLFCPPVRVLQGLGHHAFPIYLVHSIFYAGAGLALRRAGVEAAAPLVLIGTAAGLLGPVLLDRSLPQGGLLRLALFGERAAARAGRDGPAGPQRSPAVGAGLR